MLPHFTDSAKVTDEGRDYRGIEAIREWFDRTIIGGDISMKVLNSVDRDGKTIVTAEIDGKFDKTGLPDPFVMDMHYVVTNLLISQLTFELRSE
jgi:hypothetical protein